MDLNTFNIQEESRIKYWNDIVFVELSKIYFDHFKTEINLAPDIRSGNFNEQIIQKRNEQATIVNYWRDHYPKFRQIDSKIVLFKLEQSALMPDGFFAYEFTPEKTIEALNTLLDEVSVLTNDNNRLKKREQVYVGVIIIFVVIFSITLII